MNISIGIDIGSRFTKLVILNDFSTIRSEVAESGIDPVITVTNMLKEAETLLKLPQPLSTCPVCTTGYGRKLLHTSYVSEISCHSKGVHSIYGTARTVIDIGGQDSKVMVLDDRGNVIDFAMNDKCAAGTGSFFESISRIMNIPLAKIGELALTSKETLDISSTCVVFAESEIISLINRKKRIEDILMAVHYTVASRIRNMLPTAYASQPSSSAGNEIVLTGGVAHNKAMVYALQQVLKKQISVPQNPSLTGALGAALFARDNPEKYVPISL